MTLQECVLYARPRVRFTTETEEDGMTRTTVAAHDVRPTVARLRTEYPDAWIVTAPSVLHGHIVITVWED